MIALPFARGFATHMSNAELNHLAISAPLLVWRAWFGWTSRMRTPIALGSRRSLSAVSA